MAQLLLFHKPFGVLSQFTDRGADRATLADYIRLPDLYPAGRLDRDSEGLLLLTDDGQLQHQITHPKHKMRKHYWVEVEGDADATQLQQLLDGVRLNDGPARALAARPLLGPPLGPRSVPVSRAHTSWVELVISEGRNRQVRRMTAAVGLPTLRLVRHRIGEWDLEGLEPGCWRTIGLFPRSVAKRRRSRPSRS
ncbi:MAG: pseudouridine synthase [Pseudomonadota bacterium]|nr:pseudouridine synthase [Pseudomonadota bacterium]